MGWFKRLTKFAALLLASGLTAYWSILYIRPYKGVIGNLCDRTADNPNGYCYDMLPSGGFPFTFMWDRGGVSVVGSLSWIEDEFRLQPFLMNWLFYFILILVGFWVISLLGKRMSRLWNS